MAEPITFTEAEERICAECKFLVGVRSQYSDAKSWKCHAKQNVISMEKDLVSGGTIYKLALPTCYDARTSYIESASCGPTGQWFERYAHEGYRQTEYPPTKKGAPVNVDTLLKELE